MKPTIQFFVPVPLSLYGYSGAVAHSMSDAMQPNVVLPGLPLRVAPLGNTSSVVEVRLCASVRFALDKPRKIGILDQMERKGQRVLFSEYKTVDGRGKLQDTAMHPAYSLAVEDLNDMAASSGLIDLRYVVIVPNRTPSSFTYPKGHYERTANGGMKITSAKWELARLDAMEAVVPIQLIDDACPRTCESINAESATMLLDQIATSNPGGRVLRRRGIDLT